ncbi:AIE_G0006420.mRNA.1.CDS.1 [Saccharomyces cerevisiae]|nr:AIE_G0006420.mRNA.1.CDS.1 [Saccharomyces cerevisiae]CAI6525049.1 AIE_G0006420.mRNA.1.CDS.1 [Saccharomyces cerevisiae]
MVDKNLKQKIRDRFVAAEKDGHLKVTHAESKKLKNPQTATQYWVTFAPSLALKPNAKKSNDSRTVDPFANPDKELVVTDDVNGDGEYKLLLNKFPVVPEHSLLVTSEFKDQKSAFNAE